jgi:hypothetical protein
MFCGKMRVGQDGDALGARERAQAFADRCEKAGLNDDVVGAGLEIDANCVKR